MGILKHLDKNNLHHAYLIEGKREEVLPEIFNFLENLGIKTSSNPDFLHLSFDSFKIDDAYNLKSIQYEKSFSNNKKIFLISANNFLLEAQNTLLKIFEEPIENTHFFIIVPNTDILLKTLVSRFYLIKAPTRVGAPTEVGNAEKFIKMSLRERIDFVKELITEEEKEEEPAIETQSIRAKSLKFLNALESVLVSKMPFDKNMSKAGFDIQHIFKVREFLNQPGSSLKSLMESIALITPNF